MFESSLTLLLRCIRSIKELRIPLEDKIRVTSTKDMTEVKEMQTPRANGIMKLDEACGNRAHGKRCYCSCHSCERKKIMLGVKAKHEWIRKVRLIA